MSHHDAAFSQIYAAPYGLASEPCRHFPCRCRVGPTSPKRHWWLIVDQCARCGRVLRTAGKRGLTWPQYDWVRRWNRRISGEQI